MKEKVSIALIILAFVANSYAEQVLLDASADTEVYDQQPDMVMGADPVIEIHGDWVDPEELWPAKGLFRFSLSGLTGKDYIVDEALLELHVLENNIQQAPVDIFRVSESWQEMVVTWNTKPDENRDILVRETPPMGTMQEPALWDADVTGIVQSWFDEYPNYGFYIDVPNTGSWVSVLLASKENPALILHPKLRINYHAQVYCEDISSRDFQLEVIPLSSGSTEIKYIISNATEISIKVYDAAGSLVNTLSNGTVTNGVYSTHLIVPQGVYFVRAVTPGSYQVVKFTVLK